MTSKQVSDYYNRSQSISEGMGESYEEETSTGPQSFPVAVRGKKDKPEAGEAKPVYLVCSVYLVFLVERNQRNLKYHMNQVSLAAPGQARVPADTGAFSVH
jgi:hypothetical protein